MSSAETMPYKITEMADFGQEETPKEQTVLFDYKMVTFSLGGRDYGINIMKVKEIGQISRITYVPNTLPSVKGVYNLRGDIISIIDLRIMFNIPLEETPQEANQMIILNLKHHVLGVIVDSINGVVGVPSKRIQPPHPLFGDINIKYISGIVESDNGLYIILDVDEIFSRKEEEETPPPLVLTEKDSSPVSPRDKSETEVAYGFVVEGLSSLKKFFVTNVNQEWVRDRMKSWKEERGKKGQDIQLRQEADAEEFLKKFYSSHTGELWSEDYRGNFKSLLPDLPSNVVNVWNPGCSKGLETYSLATMLREMYPQKRIKIWAHDTNLLEISIAPTLVVHKDQSPSCYIPFLTETPRGYQFNSTIRDTIVFEYHDIINGNSLPPIDLILCRDVLSFLPLESQLALVNEFNKHIHPQGLLVLGENESLESPVWQPMNIGSLRVFQYKSEMDEDNNLLDLEDG